MNRKVIFSLGAIVFSLLMMYVGNNYGYVLFPGYRSFSAGLMNVLSTISGIVPFSLWDILAIFVFLYCLWSLVKKKFVNILCVVSFIFSFVVLGWMLNHYAPPLALSFGLEVREISAEELKEATAYYLDKAVEMSREVDRESYDFNELAVIAGKSYEGLAGFESGSVVRVKRFSLIGEYLMYNGIIGMFMPLTGESSVPGNVPYVVLPFTMTHETAHRLGIASEQEANFGAFMACISNDDKRFVYSGYYEAFWYCFNALYGEDKEMAMTLLYEHADIERLLQDLAYEQEVYGRYKGVLEEVGEKVNDTYLKTFGQKSGVKSYGEVVDYLVAYYESL